MEQSTNVFVIIGVITLACGQLRGLAEREKIKTEVKTDGLLLDKMNTLDSTIVGHIQKRRRNPDHKVGFGDILKNAKQYINRIKKVDSQQKNSLYPRTVLLTKHIVELLEGEKNGRRLSVDAFDEVVRIIRSIGQIYNIRVKSRTQKDIKSVVVKVQNLSNLKRSLYDLYEAKQAAENKITVLYDYTWSILGYPFSIRLRSKPLDDLLATIPPRLGEDVGWRERLAKIVKRWRAQLKFSAE